jgi:hypothetical protein
MGRMYFDETCKTGIVKLSDLACGSCFQYASNGPVLMLLHHKFDKDVVKPGDCVIVNLHSSTIIITSLKDEVWPVSVKATVKNDN